MGRLLRATLAFAAATSLVVIFSCEAIVSDQVPQFTCNGTDPSACPPNQYCKGAGCVACEKVDVCDHLDNDCNGLVDDGKLCDADGDGFTWCGQLDDQGHPQGVDCDDNDPTVYPGAPELCDGKDNDCNGKVDDGATCPATQSCFAGSCVTPCGQNNPCPSGKTCDPVSHTCVDTTTQPAGTPCTVDKECTAPLFCATASDLGGTNVLPSGASAMCTSLCCRSEDCPAQMVCYTTGTGGKYCVDPAKLGRGATGGEQGGQSEAQATRCRSGLVANGRCMDSCCTDSQCSGGTSCVFSTLDGHEGFFCGSAGGSSGQWDDCFFSGSGACHNQSCWGTSPFSAVCIDQCCGSSSCGNVAGSPGRCYFEQDSSTKEYIPLCAQQKIGAGVTGDTCTVASDCQSNVCYNDGTSKYCTDVCCVDTNCPSNWACRPAPTFLRCIKSL